MPFTKGHSRVENSGRKPGQPNKTTQLLKDAILIAASLAGDEIAAEKLRGQVGVGGSGPQGRLTEGEIAELVGEHGGLVGYLKFLARQAPASFARLLGRVLPLQTKADTRETRVYRTVEEIRAEIRRRGLPLEEHLRLPPPEDDDENGDGGGANTTSH